MYENPTRRRDSIAELRRSEIFRCESPTKKKLGKTLRASISRDKPSPGL